MEFKERTIYKIFSSGGGITTLCKKDKVGEAELEGDGKCNCSSTRMNLLVVVGILKVEENPYFLLYYF